MNQFGERPLFARSCAGIRFLISQFQIFFPLFATLGLSDDFHVSGVCSWMSVLSLFFQANLWPVGIVCIQTGPSRLYSQQRWMAKTEVVLQPLYLVGINKCGINVRGGLLLSADFGCIHSISRSRSLATILFERVQIWFYFSLFIEYSFNLAFDRIFESFV